MKINENKTINEAYEKAVEVLGECAHPVGLKASANKHGYPHVWARDSMISLLGGVLTDNKKIINALKASINILRNNQTVLGLIPNNVHTKTLKPNFQAYADGGAWFIIGNAFLYKQTKDKKFLNKNYPAIKKILKWYEYQNTDQSGLISMTEAADWEDLLAVRGKGLYVNVLYCLALKEADFLFLSLGKKKEATKLQKKSKSLNALINKHFWHKGDGKVLDHVNLGYGVDSLNRKMFLPKKTILKKSSYYLPYLSFRGFGEWFDSFGNLLAIISGVASKKQANEILNFIQKNKLAKPFPIKAIYPTIKPRQKDWRDYYRFGKLNLPNQYHNGGIWPLLGGFYVTALVKEKKYSEAKKELLQLALLNKKGIKKNWEFNEWLHGKKGKPMGMAAQAWSAGMYIYAYNTVKRKSNLFF